MDIYQSFRAENRWKDTHNALWGKPNAWVISVPRVPYPVLDLQSELAQPLLREISSRSPQIVIRNEYVELYDYIVEKAASEKPRGLVLSGQTGIGKSVFLIYALTRSLGDKRAVALDGGYSDNDTLFFDEEGVHEMKKGDYKEDVSFIGLCNSSYPQYPPPRALISAHRCFVVQATSYGSYKWHKWHKNFYVSRTVMSLWDESEIEAFAILQKQPIDKVKMLAKTFGPAPCIIDQALDDFGQYDRRVKSAAALLSKDQLTTISCTGAEESESSVLWVRPEPNQPLPRDSFQVFIPTTHISILLTARLASFTNHIDKERLDFVRGFVEYGVGCSNDLIPDFLEIVFHAYLSRGNISFELTWLHDPDVKSLRTLRNSQLLTQMPLSDPRPIIMHGMPEILSYISKTLTNEGSSINDLPAFYWRPRASSHFPAIDSAFFTHGVIYVIQATILSKHGSISGTRQGWSELLNVLQPLVARGARITCLYMVDSVAKGQEFCSRDEGREYPIGYCDVSRTLEGPLQPFVWAQKHKRSYAASFKTPTH